MGEVQECIIHVIWAAVLSHVYTLDIKYFFLSPLGVCYIEVSLYNCLPVHTLSPQPNQKMIKNLEENYAELPCPKFSVHADCVQRQEV